MEITFPNAANVKTLDAFLTYYDPVVPSNGTRHGNVTRIKYDSSTYLETEWSKYGDSNWLKPLAIALNKCGIKCTASNKYDANMEAAVREFQKRYMSDNFWYVATITDKDGKVVANPDRVEKGVLCGRTIQQILSYANNMPDYIDPETGSYKDPSYDDEASDSPHYNPFFDKENQKQFRQNHKNIQIIFGESGIVKTLHDVVMRSVGVEVDTSGNPISETYEFIARDVTETDEKEDKDKYVEENGTSPSDIQYKFNFKFDK